MAEKSNLTCTFESQDEQRYELCMSRIFKVSRTDIDRQYLSITNFYLIIMPFKTRAAHEHSLIPFLATALPSSRRLASISLAQLIQSSPLKYRISYTSWIDVSSDDSSSRIFFWQFYIASSIIARHLRTSLSIESAAIRQFVSVCAFFVSGLFNMLSLWKLFSSGVFRNVINADMAWNFSPTRASREKRQEYVDGEKRTACLPSECDQCWINRARSIGAREGERGSPFSVLINGAFLREESWDLPRPRPARVPVPRTPAPTMRDGGGTGPSIQRTSEPSGSLVWPMSRDFESSRDSK